MNRWANTNPELYEQLGHEGYIDYFRDRADLIRKRQKEEPMCRVCSEYPVATVSGHCVRCFKSMEQDRLERESGR